MPYLRFEVLFDDILVCLMCKEIGPEEPFDAKAYLSCHHVVLQFFKN